MVEMAETKSKAAEASESKGDQPARERLILAAARLFAAKSFDTTKTVSEADLDKYHEEATKIVACLKKL